MNVHILQHVPFEGIGSMEPWLAARGARLRYTRFFASPSLPEVTGLDLVIAMGGPMSVNDEAENSFGVRQNLHRWFENGEREGRFCLAPCERTTAAT